MLTTSDSNLSTIGSASRKSSPIVPEVTTPPRTEWGFPEWFAVAQVAGPAILYLPGTQVFRTPLRLGVFGLSLFGLAWCMRLPRSRGAHPSWWLLVAGAVYMTIMLTHPQTNTLLAGLAQIGMHLSVAAPLFWAPRYFRGDPERLLRVMTILWFLNCASVMVGILQVRYPDRFMPAEFSSQLVTTSSTVGMYEYRGADGRKVIRPPGLGDTPGAASGAGLFVGIVALAFLGLPVSRWKKSMGIVMGVAGVVIIFLSHVRSSLVVLVGCGLVYAFSLVWQGRLKTVLTLAILTTACGACSLYYAESLGGQSTLDRFATLLADDPTKVLESTGRMSMVAHAFDTLLVENPIGAGLGRWGMMRRYFGDESNPDSPEIWSEVQFSSWILDGGIVLLSLYLLAIVVALQRLIRLSLFPSAPSLAFWGPVIIMLSASPIALLFSYTPFNSQMGIQFWFLIGAFEGLARGENK